MAQSPPLKRYAGPSNSSPRPKPSPNSSSRYNGPGRRLGSVMDDGRAFVRPAASRDHRPAVAANQKSDHLVIDLADDSPEQPRRHRGPVMDGGRSYRPQSRSAAAAAKPPVIDLANESHSPAAKPKVRTESIHPPQKRKRMQANITHSEYTSAPEARAAPKSSEHLPDGGMITYNLLELIDQFRNANILTINGTQSDSNSPININSKTPINRQPCHITQNDKWSCGFRNLQMLISSLLQTSLFPSIPSIPELQFSFELLWSEGFDDKGAQHHNSKMVGKVGKISWIGAVEVWSYFAFRGVDCTIVQFANTLERRCAIGSFVWAYFSRLAGGDCPCQGRVRSRLTSWQYVAGLMEVTRQNHGSGHEAPCILSCGCTLLPLYLQWEGHSVTIVGIRRERCIAGNGTPFIRYHLIVFDPQKNGETIRSNLNNELKKGQRQPNALSFTEMSCERMHFKDTQILVSTGRITSEVERERCKQQISCISFVV